jgi:hypothetical protein
MIHDTRYYYSSWAINTLFRSLPSDYMDKGKIRIGSTLFCSHNITLNKTKSKPVCPNSDVFTNASLILNLPLMSIVSPSMTSVTGQATSTPSLVVRVGIAESTTRVWRYCCQTALCRPTGFYQEGD